MQGSVKNNYLKQDKLIQKCQLEELIKANKTLSDILSVNKVIQEQTDQVENLQRELIDLVESGVSDIIAKIEEVGSSSNEETQAALNDIKSSIEYGNAKLGEIKTGIDSIDNSITKLNSDIKDKLQEIKDTGVITNTKLDSVITKLTDGNADISEIKGLSEDIKSELIEIKGATDEIEPKLDVIIDYLSKLKPEEEKDCKPHHRVVKGSVITIKNPESISWSVTEGSVDVTINGEETVTYPASEVVGATYDVVGIYKIDATNGEAYVNWSCGEVEERSSLNSRGSVIIKNPT